MSKTQNQEYVDNVVPDIKLTDSIGSTYTIRTQVKVLRDETIDERIILLKYVSTTEGLDSMLETGKLFILELDRPIMSMSAEMIEIKNEKLENMYLVNKYTSRNTNGNNCDFILVFSSNLESGRFNRLLEKEEKEQLNNTIYKVKPNDTYKVEVKLEKINDTMKLTEQTIRKIMEEAKKISAITITK